jgi:hypothetical protein
VGKYPLHPALIPPVWKLVLAHHRVDIESDVQASSTLILALNCVRVLT